MDLKHGYLKFLSSNPQQIGKLDFWQLIIHRLLELYCKIDFSISLFCTKSYLEPITGSEQLQEIYIIILCQKHYVIR